ncbi:MerR family transcriptional regulator [Zavarzinia sp. CC-PAN008]|uniref:MerR family transcriptional regulator n=1 Tax=Zavarzinia sp. CC-PAN008 TaxID=3243332 RepID=UPI003F744E75
MKMRDLERLTGVNRETIRTFLRHNLLPEPDRPKRNVAEYNEAHVAGILAIRRLQREQRLSLPQIERALAGDQDSLPRDPGAFPQLDRLLAARLGEDGGTVPVASLLARNPKAQADAEALARIGAVQIQVKGGEPHLSVTDIQIVTLWGEMRAVGFTEENGFAPEITRHYVEIADDLAEQEVSRFLGAVAGRVEPARAAEMAENAVTLMLRFFGMLRRKAVLEAFARHAAPEGQATLARAGSRPP